MGTCSQTRVCIDLYEYSTVAEVAAVVPSNVNGIKCVKETWTKFPFWAELKIHDVQRVEVVGRHRLLMAAVVTNFKDF